MSLDEVDSSNPNLTAVHAGASTRKTGHLQPNASNAADAEGELFCLFRLASHIRVLSKSVEKPALHSKTTISHSSVFELFFKVGFLLSNKSDQQS